MIKNKTDFITGMNQARKALLHCAEQYDDSGQSILASWADAMADDVRELQLRIAASQETWKSRQDDWNNDTDHNPAAKE